MFGPRVRRLHVSPYLLVKAAQGEPWAQEQVEWIEQHNAWVDNFNRTKFRLEIAFAIGYSIAIPAGLIMMFMALMK